MESPAAIIAFKDSLIIAGQGLSGSVYVREWKPIRMESWDSCRNSQNLGVNNWYPLEGGTTSSPELTVENGTLFIYVTGRDGGIYRKQYYAPYEWSPSWQLVRNHEFSPGPFSASGFTVIPSNSSGYPSMVSLVKFKNFTIPQSKPDCINDLIIYEIVTKTFTSPNGPGTGNFNSLMKKLDYLEDLGINAIWLSGHSWSDPRHFTNVYTQYANIHPALIDPGLGSDPSNVQKIEQEFKGFVQAAHQRGIKVLLDVVTHGVMSYSPLVMANSTFPSYVASHPLQSSITPHPDWFGAFTYPVDESEVGPRDPAFIPYETRMIDFVVGYEQSDLDNWWVDVWTNYVLDYGIDGLRLDLGSSRFDLWARIKENAFKVGHELIIIPEGELDDYPFDIGVYDLEQTSWEWLIFAAQVNNISNPAYGTVITDMKKAQGEVFPKLDQQFYIIPLSVHDSRSYNLQGSLFEMGYGSLFTPFIPLFMAGEEFNNPNTPVPDCTIDWLLASELQWNLLNNLQNRLFYLSMKKAINIRKTEPALNYFSPKGDSPNVVIVENFTSSLSETPTPYLRFIPDGNEAILIVGNNYPDKKVCISMNIPLSQVGLKTFDYYKIKDLWSNNEDIVSHQEMQSLEVVVNPDNFRILKLTPYYGNPPSKVSIFTYILLTVAICGLVMLSAIFFIKWRTIFKRSHV